MDDLSPEVRLIVETARDTRLTRAEKARLWNQLGQRRHAPARARGSMFVFRKHWFALPVAGALLLGLVVTRHGASPESAPGEHATATEVRGVQAPAPRQATAATARPAIALQVLAPAPSQVPSKARRRSASGASVTAARDARARAEIWTPAASAVPELEQVAAVRVQPARTRVLPSPLTAPAEVAVRVAVGVSEEPPRRSPSFQEKLAAENLARYQAALAQHARLAAIRRSPSSIGGYAAW